MLLCGLQSVPVKCISNIDTLSYTRIRSFRKNSCRVGDANSRCERRGFEVAGGAAVTAAPPAEVEKGGSRPVFTSQGEQRKAVGLLKKAVICRCSHQECSTGLSLLECRIAESR